MFQTLVANNNPFGAMFKVFYYRKLLVVRCDNLSEWARNIMM
jgi:hypothetical protein